MNMSVLLFDIAGLQIGASSGGDEHVMGGGNWQEFRMVATPDDIVTGTFSKPAYAAIALGGLVTAATSVYIDEVTATPMATISSGQLLTGDTEGDHTSIDGNTIETFSGSGVHGPLIINARSEEGFSPEDPSGRGVFVANRNVPLMWGPGQAVVNPPMPGAEDYDGQALINGGIEGVAFAAGDGQIAMTAFPNGVLTVVATYGGPDPGIKALSVASVPTTALFHLRLEDSAGVGITGTYYVFWFALGW
jgi:hypothetical protein